MAPIVGGVLLGGVALWMMLVNLSFGFGQPLVFVGCVRVRVVLVVAVCAARARGCVLGVLLEQSKVRCDSALLCRGWLLAVVCWCVCMCVCVFTGVLRCVLRCGVVS